MTTDNAPALRARAFWVAAAGQGELRAATLAAPGPDAVLVRTLHGAVSRGTETLVFSGRVPESQYAAMRAPFQEGDFPFPVKYGYISVGTVEAGPAELKGRTVFCLYPHQDRYVVPSDAVTLLPEGLPPARAVLAANMETALNGVWDLAPGPGDRVAVIGGGTVGCMVAWLIGRMPGCRVELVDTDPDKGRIARALGVSFALPADAAPDADAVVHVSGNPAGLRTALSLAGFEATVLEMSWFGDAEVTLPLGEGFHSRRLTIKSSQVGHLPPQRRGRWSYRRRMAAALDLLRDPALDVLITGASRFDDLPGVMARLASAPPGTLCHRIDYD